MLALTQALGVGMHLDNFYQAHFPRSRGPAPSWGKGQVAVRQAIATTGICAAALPRCKRLLYADQQTYLVELLMKQDQMSMASSIESRVPFLDHTLVSSPRACPMDQSCTGKTGNTF